MKAKPILETNNVTPQRLAEAYIRNRGSHYVKIVEETQNYWRGYHVDCLIAAETECLKSGNSSGKS